MNNQHLTDTEIQQYVLNEGGEEMNRAANHMKACSSCHQRSVEYKNMISGIRQQDFVPFYFGVTEIVMADLPVKQRSQKYVWQITLTLLILVVTGACILKYIFGNYFPVTVNAKDQYTFYLSALMAGGIVFMLGREMCIGYSARMKRIYFQ